MSKSEHGSMDPDEVQLQLSRLADGPCYLKAISDQQDHVRWLSMTESGYLWIVPGEGRKRRSGEDDARSTLRHYDSLEIVPESDAPAQVVKMDQGLRAFTDGGQPSTGKGHYECWSCGGEGEKERPGDRVTDCVACAGSGRITEVKIRQMWQDWKADEPTEAGRALTDGGPEQPGTEQSDTPRPEAECQECGDRFAADADAEMRTHSIVEHGSPEAATFTHIPPYQIAAERGDWDD